MIRVEKLIQALQKLPTGACVYAYEGEVVCLVVVCGRRNGTREQVGYIEANAGDTEDSGKLEIG